MNISGGFIEDLTWPEIAKAFAKKLPILMPIGAQAKEHGPHLPMNNDFLLARHLGAAVAQRFPLLIAPVVGFGYYPAFRAYPGSQHLRAETFMAVLSDLIENYLDQGAGPIILLNTGFSTEAPIALVLDDLWHRRHVKIGCIDIRHLGKKRQSMLEQQRGSHADEHETSLMLHLAPQLVRMELARQDYGKDEPPILRQAAMLETESGIFGDATLATPEKGKILFDAMTEDLVNALETFLEKIPR